MKEIQIFQKGVLGYTIPPSLEQSKKQRLIVDPSTSQKQIRSIFSTFEEKNRLITSSPHPTITAIINSFFAVYAFADTKPDGSLTSFSTDILLDQDVLNWAKAMFDYYDQPFPNIEAEVIEYPRISNFEKTDVTLSMFSGGKDSTYMSLIKQSIPIHVYGINSGMRGRELKVINDMKEKLSYHPYIVPLINSLKFEKEASHRYQVRDTLLYVLTLPIAHKHGATTLFSGTYESEKRFGNSKESISLLNALLEKKGISTKIELVKEIDEETLIDRFIKKDSELFNLTSPCVFDAVRHTQWRSYFTKKFPFFPLGKYVCGMCGKDVQLNLSRLLHDEEVLELPFEQRKQLVSFYINKIERGGNVTDFILDSTVSKVKDMYLNKVSSIETLKPPN